MSDTDILFLPTLGKPETQTFGGVGYLKFFCMMHIYEMAASFRFCHNADIPHQIKLETLIFLGGQVSN